MKKDPLILTFACILLFASCNDDNGITPTPSSQKDYAAFLRNTEWVGVLDGSGLQYPRPCSLKFNEDNTFTMHSLFIFFTKGVETSRDSITGTINSIDSLSDGRTRISTSINTNFASVITESIYITQRSKLVGMSSDPTKQPTFQLELFPKDKISVDGEWSGPARTSPGASYAYPDLSSIKFSANEGVTYYVRNGQSVIHFAPNQLLRVVYQQKGARVYMAGHNENFGMPDNRAQIAYFGVLLPSGDKMMVDSRDMNARLPNYVNTNQPYGPSGATPIISRK
jgi:hypothetical protein